MRTATSLLVISSLLLAACGGGGNTAGSPSAGPITNPPTTNPPATSGCTLSNRQTFARDVINEWYLFPDLVATNVNPASFTTVQDYIDALVAPARAQSRDRFFTFITSIQEENAFFSSGSSAGFGIRLNYNDANRTLFVVEAFEGAPALTAGIDRGTEILAIGTTANNLQTVTSLFQSGGAGAVSNALGPSDPGVSRVLRIRNGSTTSEVTVTKTEFDLPAVSSRYGARVIQDRGRSIGYINLRTFISSANTPLRDAFDTFRQQGITEFVIDFRYNGGGLVSVADLMGNLLGGNRTSNELFNGLRFRTSKASNDESSFFAPQPQSVSPTKIAFITTGSSASASEVVINSLAPFYGTNLALIGENTFGKPTGQVALDRSQCDDRVRVLAFRNVNSAGTADYFTGLASTLQRTCQAGDDFTRQLGDPQEASLRKALDFLAGDSCTPISATARTGLSVSTDGRAAFQALRPSSMSTPQMDVPGLY